MSHSFDDGVKERIREAIDIVELVSQYVPLKRSGRNFVGRCPWHDDSRPSLQVNPVRQTFKCWVCDIGGDVFAFVMKMENVDFKEALEILADKAGVTLPKKSGKKIFLKQRPDPVEVGNVDDAEPNRPGPGAPKEITKQALFSAVDWLAGTYHQALLKLDEAEAARKYLDERGLGPEEIETFQIGYAPMQAGWLADKVKRIPERMQILEIVGNLLPPSPDGERYGGGSAGTTDRFRGRVLFPIRDTQNRTVAFGGRVIPGGPLNSPAKYLNSPETPLFSKQRMLYGLDLARHRMKDTRRALIMEGYTDCIVAHKYGFRDAVAVLGTALGPEHIRILKRFADKMILVLDGDEAGRKRADQVLELFVAQGVDMSVLTLPAGMDPADFLQEHGAEAFELLLETETVDALEHAFRSATAQVDLEHDIIGSSNALDSILGIIAQAPVRGTATDDPVRIRLEKTIQNLSHRFLVTEQQIRQRLKEKRRRLESRPAPSAAENRPEHPDAEQDGPGWWKTPELMPDALEREMLELWLADPTAIYLFWETVPPERCRSPVTRAIYETCNRLIEQNKPASFDRLIVAMDDPKMKSFLVELDESGREKRHVDTASLNREDARDETVAFHDEVSELEKSLRSETEEDRPLAPEYREQLIREILDGFDRRDEQRNRLSDVNELRDESLTGKEKIDKLLLLQEQIRKRQEEKKKRHGLDS